MSTKTQKKGKIAECQVASKFIALDLASDAIKLELYAPIVDTGIDYILRTEELGKPTRYYELQIKSSKYNVSIRNAGKVIRYLRAKNPENYFLIIVIKEKGKIHFIYLEREQVKGYVKTFPNSKEIDLNIPSKDRDFLIKSQTLESLINFIRSRGDVEARP